MPKMCNTHHVSTKWLAGRVCTTAAVVLSAWEVAQVRAPDRVTWSSSPATHCLLKHHPTPGNAQIDTSSKLSTKSDAVCTVRWCVSVQRAPRLTAQR